MLPRRRLLAASATMLPLLATSACVGPNPLAGPPSPSPDVIRLRAAITAEEALIKTYRDAIASAPVRSAGSAHSTVPKLLSQLLAQHEQHLARLRGRLIEPAGAAASPSPTPTASASAQRPPSTASGIVALLRDAEQASAATQVRRLTDAAPALAQLLASIAASDATHVTVLTPALTALRQAGA
jgi:hypothetical protein